eukprot:SAG11_NODE_7_length_31267_cov_19.541966_10_plen_211_part_00
MDRQLTHYRESARPTHRLWNHVAVLFGPPLRPTRLTPTVNTSWQSSEPPNDNPVDRQLTHCRESARPTHRLRNHLAVLFGPPLRPTRLTLTTNTSWQSSEPPNGNPVDRQLTHCREPARPTQGLRNHLAVLLGPPLRPICLTLTVNTSWQSSGPPNGTSGKALEARGADHRWHPSSDLEPLTSLVPRLPGLRGWISHPVPPAYQVKRYID